MPEATRPLSSEILAIQDYEELWFDVDIFSWCSYSIINSSQMRATIIISIHAQISCYRNWFLNQMVLCHNDTFIVIMTVILKSQWRHNDVVMTVYLGCQLKTLMHTVSIETSSLSAIWNLFKFQIVLFSLVNPFPQWTLQGKKHSAQCLF